MEGLVDSEKPKKAFEWMKMVPKSILGTWIFQHCVHTGANKILIYYDDNRKGKKCCEEVINEAV